MRRPTNRSASRLMRKELTSALRSLRTERLGSVRFVRPPIGRPICRWPVRPCVSRSMGNQVDLLLLGTAISLRAMGVFSK